MTTKRYTIWTAREHELDTVMRLLHERVQWLRDRGSDQWSTYQRWRPEIENSVRRHETWLLRDADTYEAVGTITMSPHSDPEFWTEQEREVRALYLAKLATSPARRGEGLGALLLEFSHYCAVADQYRELRVDVWKTAHGLHNYYRQQGWAYLRTVDLPHRHSGALFTRQVVAPTVNLPPHGLTIRPAGNGNVPKRPIEPGELAWYGRDALLYARR